MEEWEFMIATYMHETKIADIRLRRNILSYPGTELYLYKQITKWANEQDTYEEYCYI